MMKIKSFFIIFLLLSFDLCPNLSEQGAH